MSLIHTDTDIATLKINRFSTVEDYELAIQQGLIGENEISIIDENFQPDWNQTDPTAPDYIKNKPEPGAGRLSELTDVDVNSPVNDDSLVYNGLQWVNRPVIYRQASAPVNPTDNTLWIDTSEEAVVFPVPSQGDAGKILSVDSNGNYALLIVAHAEQQQY